MFAVLKRNPVAFALAVLLHLGLAVLLIFGVDWQEKPPPLPGGAQVVQARVVSQQAVDQELGKLKKAEQDKKAAAQAARRKQEQQLAELRKRREAEKRQLAALEKQRKARQAAAAKQREQQRLQAAAEKKRLAELAQQRKKLQQQQAQEKKRLADLAAKRAAEQKARQAAQAKQKAEAAAKAKAEAKAKAAAKAKAKAEAAAKAKAKAAREAELQAQIQAEQDASELRRVVAAIQAKVQQNWLQPPGVSDRHLQSTVRVRLGESGSVLAVSTVKSSGNTAFDRSVESAVYKADPLPMPTSPRLLARFRDIRFVFSPQE